MNWQTISYCLAILTSVVFLIAAIGMTGIVVVEYVDWKMHMEQGYAPPIISMFGILVAAVGTFSGVLFGWRKDRREAKDAALKAQELELRIKELEAKLGSET